MDAQQESATAGHHGTAGVGEHTHQLLHLAHALSHTDSPSSDEVRIPLLIDAAKLTDQECITWAQDVEALLRFGQALAVQIAGEIGQRSSVGRYSEIGARGDVDLLVQTLQLSAREANKRLRLAEQIMPISDPVTGAITPPARPVISKAFFTGDISQERALTVVHFAQDADRLVTNGQINVSTAYDVEETLVNTARDLGPDFVRAVGNQIMSHIDPDGNKPTDADLRAKQGIFFRKPRNGLVGMYGHCTIEQYEQLMASIAAEANPNHHRDTIQLGDRGPVTECDGAEINAEEESRSPNCGTPAAGLGSCADPGSPGEPDSAGDSDPSDTPWPRIIDGASIPVPGSVEDFPTIDSRDANSTDSATCDDRTRGQKLLDGLISCVRLASRTGRLPMNGGLKAQLILTTTEEDLRRRDGLGTVFTSYSGPMPLSLFSLSLCDPEITPMVYGEGQDIISAGRTQRLFTAAQRKLLFARDLGCSFPDCTAPATWCDAHHIIPWQQGGPTDVSNGCLLCSHHHTLLHYSDWRVELIEGTPWFTPPWTIDRERRPRRNNYHRGLPKRPDPPGSRPPR